MGGETLKVPMALFAENRSRLAAALRANVNTPENSIVLLQGGRDQVWPLLIAGTSGQCLVLVSGQV